MLFFQAHVDRFSEDVASDPLSLPLYPEEPGTSPALDAA